MSNSQKGLLGRVRSKWGDATFLARYRLAQLKRIGRSPALCPVGQKIVADIKREGVAMVPLEALPFASNAALSAALAKVDEDLESLTPDSRNDKEYKSGFDHCIPINPTHIATQYPELYLWGLDDGMLDIIENCLGLPPAYHGVIVRKEIVDGKLTGTRLWHADSEDLNIIRVMIYLNDVVDDAGGPFEYIPRYVSASYRDFAGVDKITDKEMDRVVPQWQWRRALGRRGTVIFGAVAKVFHHGMLPFTARKMASYHYTSRRPMDERLCKLYSFETGMPLINAPLSTRQAECLWHYRELLPGHSKPAQAGRKTGPYAFYASLFAAEPVLSLLSSWSTAFA